MFLAWTHWCRIYRAKVTQVHDLSLLRGSEDVYGEDKPCRVMPAEAELLEIPSVGEMGMIAQPAELWFPRNVDIDVGWIVDVKKTMTLNGRRRVVSTALRSAAEVGATTLSVKAIYGFDPGDILTISGGGNTQYSRMRSADDLVLTVYAEDAMDYGFPAATTVTSSRHYKVMSRVVPHDVGPIIKVNALAIPHKQAI
jgi:hypothetical protein